MKSADIDIEPTYRRGGLKIRVLDLLLIFCLAFSTSVAGQTPQESRPRQTEPPAAKDDSPKSDREPSSPKAIFASSDDYLIGPNDVIEINVMDAPELSGKHTVSAAGFIPLRFLGDLEVKGKRPADVAKIIAEGLRGDYLKDPHVTVTVAQSNSRSFFIQGSVRSPGVYQMMGKVSLFKLITTAGGLSDNHGPIAYIIREVESAGPSEDGLPEYVMLEANISGLLKGHFEQNMLIEPGDLINIPPTDVFFVGGAVAVPGQFPLRPGITLRQAISLARGMTFEASKSNAKIFREDSKTGQQKEISVDIGAVMDGKKDDILLQANDLIVVPSSRLKSVGGTLLRAFGMATVNRGVIR
ncbi:MAG: polysaccharide export protein [Blastocatellia bacterium]|nr:polysaccharide export protein [Blastocatellia bacterium]